MTSEPLKWSGDVMYNRYVHLTILFACIEDKIRPNMPPQCEGILYKTYSFFFVKHSGSLTMNMSSTLRMRSSRPKPLSTWRNDNAVITSKRRHFDVIMSKWRRFDAIATSLLRNVSAGKVPTWMARATAYEMAWHFCTISRRPFIHNRE